MLLKLSSQGVALAGLGHALPAQAVDNAALIARGGLPVDPAWIRRRIGVEQRYFAAPDQNTSDLALAAARAALANADTDPADLDLILLATLSPDHPSPATACAVQAGLGIRGCPAFDLKAACSGFLYALDTGARHILTGARRVLVVAAEIRSRLVNLQDPGIAPIFGDAAAAVVLSSGPSGSGLLAIECLADGSGYYSVHIPAGGTARPTSAETVAAGEHYLKMNNGEKIFFEVVEAMSTHTPRFLAELGLTLADIDYVIPHQANLNILHEVGRRLALPPEKMLINLPQVGNTSSASIPLALSQFRDQIPAGSRVLLVAAGAGHTLGLALLRMP
jgi:3-oxoacyl-[acyl-carrier-protein] synthase-3